MQTTHTATSAFHDKTRAEQAADNLVRAGFARDAVRIERRQGEHGGYVVVVDAEDAPDLTHAPGLRYADKDEPNG